MKFIKVTRAQMKQVNERICYIASMTEVNENTKNQCF